MVRVIFASFFGLLIQQQYFEFKPPDNRFRILVWNVPTEQIISIPTDLGRIDFHTLETEIPLDSGYTVMGAVSFCEYPEGSIHSDSISLHADFFTTTIQQSVVRLKGLLVYEDEYFLGHYPGRIWRIHYNDAAAVMKSRAFLIDNRLYVIQVASLKENSLHPNIDLFLNSFRSLN